MTRSHRAYLWQVLVVSGLLIAGCSSISHESKNREAITSLVAQVNSKYYVVSASDLKEISFYCQSDLVNAMIGNIKDDVLRNQLRNTKFVVKWDGTTDFKIRISDIPRLQDPESDKKLKGVITRVKDRMLGAFTGAAFVFGGVSASDLSLAESVTKQDGHQILGLRGANGVKHNFYFNNDLLLEKSEVTYGPNVIVDVQYEFEEKSNKFYLKHSRVHYPKTNTVMSMNFDYKNFEGIDLPAVFDGNLKIEKLSLQDTIRVLKVEIVRRAKSG